MSESARLEQIEFKLSHLERALGELGATVMRQQREIDALNERGRHLHDQLRALEAGTGDSTDPFERPPHY